MTSPSLIQASAGIRTENDVRAERFITAQLAALRDLGLPPETLAREESLLKGGLHVARVVSEIMGRR